MDELDRALLAACSAITARLETDPAEAVRRARRRTRPTYNRPPRAWCLSIRSSDQRINPYTTWCEPRHACDDHAPHAVTLTPALIRLLCKPVDIPWPGIPHDRAAALLGRDRASIRHWIRKGAFIARYDKPSIHSRGGSNPTPVLYTPSPLDPSSSLGRPPDLPWGTLWQHLYKQVPYILDQTVERIPRTRTDPRDHAATPRHRGWLFLCPGLPGKPCNQPVRRLFLPLPPRNLAHFLNHDPLASVSLPIDRVPRLVPQGKACIPKASSFACRSCHRVRDISLINDHGWSEFIAFISAGLLYGHEVARPPSQVTPRKRRYTKHAKPAPRRDQVAALLAQGLSYQQIADRLDITRGTVSDHAQKIYRRYAVHSQSELATALEAESNPQTYLNAPATNDPRP